jgi:hypothetical protein
MEMQNQIAKRSFLAATLFILATAFAAGPTYAETATNLKCKGCVGKKELGKKAVRSKNIKPNAIRSDKIANGSVAPEDLAVTAKPSGGNYSGGNQNMSLTVAPTIVRSVTVNAPANGLVIVNASGYVYTDDAVTTIARCSLTTGTELEADYFIFMKMEGNVSEESDAFGATRGFPVTAGPTTFNLVCDEFSGDGVIADTQMTAIYVPQTY